MLIIELIFIMGVIEAFEGGNVARFYLQGAFLHAKNDGDNILKEKLAEL